MMLKKVMLVLVLAVSMIVEWTMAETLGNINYTNSAHKSIVTLSFNHKPVYAFLLLHNPERVVVDINQSDFMVPGLPFHFSDEKIIKCIRVSTPVNKQSIRLVLELTHTSHAQVMTRQVGGRYDVVLIVTSAPTVAITSIPQPQMSAVVPVTNTALLSRSVVTIPFAAASSSRHHHMDSCLVTTVAKPRSQLPAATEQVVVAIDAGHGGQDPGATGPNGLHEKNVTIAIARKLRTLLARDRMFRPVLTHDGKYFISVLGRSDVARKKGASVLVSIHADAAPNRRANGASVWVLSNRRANSEMANWLEQHEKQSELLGGASDLLANANSQADPYLSQAVIDLQFSYSQRVGYDIAVKVLGQLQKVGALHKCRPEHASLGVLRSPDIPSLLVETGFISNTHEEQLLGSNVYQDKIANALYLGLRAYFLAHPLQKTSPKFNRSLNCLDADVSATQAVVKKKACAFLSSSLSSFTTVRHVVKRGDTLSSISHQYGVSIEVIRLLNKLTNDTVWVDQWLSIPIEDSAHTVSPIIFGAKSAIYRRHQVARGDNLIVIAFRYGVSTSEIKHANNMRSNHIKVGQMLTIPPASG